MRRHRGKACHARAAQQLQQHGFRLIVSVMCKPERACALLFTQRIERAITLRTKAVIVVDLYGNMPDWDSINELCERRGIIPIEDAAEALGEKDGVISLTAEQVRPGPDAARAPNLPGAGYIRLEVSDTGCGMTQEIQARMFDPFFTTKFAGRGLGLAAVQGIMRRHNGIMNFVSAPDQGSRFEILLPCTSESAQDGHDAAAAATTVNSGNITGTVLMVEDEAALRCGAARRQRH